MRLEAMAVKFPHVDGHPNRVPFEGVLTMVNAASDKAPAGARGHRVMLTHAAAEAALPSLLGSTTGQGGTAMMRGARSGC
jgi:hypothetical protein